MNTLLCRFLSPEQALSLNPNLPVWFNPLWMNPIAHNSKIIPKVLVCFKNDNPIAWLPFYEKCFMTLKKAYTPLLVYYCPLVFDFPDRKKTNRELLLEYEITFELGEALKKNYKRIHLNLNPGVYDVRGFKDAGLKAEPQYTFIKDLNNPAEFFPDEMTKLRKAQKHDYVFAKAFHPERHLDLLYQMYARKKHPFPIERDGLLKLLIDLYKAGFIEQYTISLRDTIVSSQLNIIDKGETVFGWQAATEPEALKNGVSILMFWNLFRCLSERYIIYDWCGANVKGPSRLKAAMGADLKLFFQIRKS